MSIPFYSPSLTSSIFPSPSDPRSDFRPAPTLSQLELWRCGEGRFEVKMNQIAPERQLEHMSLMLNQDYIQTIKNGNLEALKLFWKKEKDGKWLLGPYYCAYAAEAGQIEILKWLRSNECPWNEKTCAYAAKNGHLEILKWARAHGCPWDDGTCDQAAKNGRLDTLKWARQNGCPWNQYMAMYAGENEDYEMLKWVIEEGCVCGKDTFESARECGYLDVLEELLRARGDMKKSKKKRKPKKKPKTNE